MPWLSCQVLAHGTGPSGTDVWKIRGQSSYMAYDYAFPMRYWSATVYGFANLTKNIEKLFDILLAVLNLVLQIPLI